MRGKKWLKISIALMVVAALAVTAVSASAYWPGGERGGRGLGGSMGTFMEAIAEQLGMTQGEVVGALWDGKTISQLAEEKGVSLDAIVEVVSASWAESLAEAVEAGRLTQAQADAQLALFKANLSARLDGTFMSRGLFADEDGDGVCDNCGANLRSRLRERMPGMGRFGGRGG